jgi:hypothetical protein
VKKNIFAKCNNNQMAAALKSMKPYLPYLLILVVVGIASTIYFVRPIEHFFEAAKEENEPMPETYEDAVEAEEAG